MMDILAPLSFIDNVGQILINSYVKEHRLEDEFNALIIQKETLEEAEVELIGRTSQEIVSELFKHWLFENALVETMSIVDYVKSDSHYLEHARILHVMRTLVNNKEQFSPKQIEKGLSLANDYGLDRTSLQDEINRLIGLVA
jgi:HD-like signal output (HDOD) protein